LSPEEGGEESDEELEYVSLFFDSLKMNFRMKRCMNNDEE